MNLLLVDTGPLVALANKRDKYHQDCSAFLANYRGRLLTTWSVLTEFSHLACSVSSTLALYQWIERGGMEVATLGRDELVSTIDWITRYADRPMDLADASLPGLLTIATVSAPAARACSSAPACRGRNCSARGAAATLPSP